MKRIKDTWKDVLNTQNGVRAVIEGTRYKRGENEVRKLLLDGSYHQIDPEKAKEFVEPLIESLRDFSW